MHFTVYTKKEILLKMLPRFAPCIIACLVWSSSGTPRFPVALETKTALSNGLLANVHVDYSNTISTPVSITFGSCTSTNIADAHQLVGTSSHAGPHRLIWKISQDAVSNGCLSAWDLSGRLVGRSGPQQLLAQKPHIKRGPGSIAMNTSQGINALGPWFEGVKLLKSKQPDVVHVQAAKSKQVAIVGAGMAGLMTYLILHQAGLTNITILEGDNRLGGRVHTEYLSGGPADYSYQEMGPMRLPETTVFSNVTYNISDQQIVFQLIQEMNAINKKSPQRQISLIPWIQDSPNGLVYFNEFKMPNGLPPTQAQVDANNALLYKEPMPESAIKLGQTLQEKLPGDDFLKEMAQNMFKAHAHYLENGLAGLPGDKWSEFAFIVNYLNASLSDESYFTFTGLDSPAILDQLYDKLVFGPTTSFKAIDGGMNRLPLSFRPLVENITRFDSNIKRIDWDEKKERLTLQWQGRSTGKVLKKESFDYAIISAPFPVVRKWRLPRLSHGIRQAIDTLAYASSCKVALEYKSRFWERLPSPIFGSCSTTTDIPGIGSICYPSYNMNSSGPAALLASYSAATYFGQDWTGVSEEHHVQYVVDAMAEIHGDVAYKEYTGKYKRKCWSLDELEQGAWASPQIGDHQLNIPEYFTTHKNMIFIGEHTSYTQAWIASALESGIRGSVQLLLELGLVDEAKATVDKWMARWIHI